MTPEEYAKRYGMRPSELRKLLKKGRVRGARFVAGDLAIPENAMIEYYTRQKMNRTIQDIVWDITRAANWSQYFDEEVLLANKLQFSTALGIAIDLKYITRSEVVNDGVTSSGYVVTGKGMTACEKRKKEFVSDIMGCIGTLTGSTAGSFYAAQA